MSNTATIIAEKTLEDRIIEYLGSAFLDSYYEGFVTPFDIANAVNGQETMKEIVQTLNDLWYADVLEYDDIQTYTGFAPMYRLIAKEESDAA